jgi:SH3-like domain-containing protein
MPIQVSLTLLADTQAGRRLLEISLPDGRAPHKARRSFRRACASITGSGNGIGHVVVTVRRERARFGRTIVLFRAALAALVMLGWAAGMARAGGDATASGLPVPRFVSLKADRVTVRGGPDKDHDVAWIYTRVGWPVEITAEFENWRRIRDSDGSEGWVYHSLLSGKRMAAVQLKTKTDLAPLYAKPDAKSAVTAQLQVGVLGTVKHCTGTWCQITGDGFDGWIEQNELWGVYPDEKIE